MFKYEAATSLSLKTAGFKFIIKKAKGDYIWDTKGKRYYDFTSFFGVSLFGHFNSFIIKNVKNYFKLKPHSMADLFPYEKREKLSEEIINLFKNKDLLCTFGISGTESVEIAIKTSFLYTGREKIISFKNSYHGLSLSVLPFTNLEHFQKPFKKFISKNSIILNYPEKEEDLKDLERSLKKLNPKQIAAIIVEPIQGRGGIKVPPKNFLSILLNYSKNYDIVLIVDEILTGFARTGKDFCFQHEIEFPDIVCLGKALGGGFPISACVGRKEIMKVWETKGDPLYASTFLTHPLTIISSLSFLELYKRKRPLTIIREREIFIEKTLKKLKNKEKIKDIRGKGIIWGIEFKDEKFAHDVWMKILKRGFLTLLEGEKHNVLAFIPSIEFSKKSFKKVIKIIDEIVF
ncbi:MAG: aspartate aminotransferase family protein [Candidatus Hydrothermales bacterium]